MKIDRIWLHYKGKDAKSGDIIIVDKEEHLSRFDMSQIESIEVKFVLSLEEFHRIRAMDQVIFSGTVTSSNITA